MNKIKLYSYYTDDITVLKNNFINSIKDDWDINIQEIDKLNGDSNFGSKQFIQITKNKFEFLKSKILENMNNIIIYSDVDIQFFRPCNDIILDLIKGYDILFQEEELGTLRINSGFIVIRCNNNTYNLFNNCSTEDISEKKFFDQTIIQENLENINGLKWNVLPKQFYNRIHGDGIPTDIIIHHATCTCPELIDGVLITSLTKKIIQLKDVKENYENINKN